MGATPDFGSFRGAAGPIEASPAPVPDLVFVCPVCAAPLEVSVYSDADGIIDCCACRMSWDTEGRNGWRW